MGYYLCLQVIVVETQVGLLLEFGGLEQMPNLNLISWLLAVVCLKPNDSQKVSFSWKFSRKLLGFFDKSGITVRMDMKNVIMNFDSLQIDWKLNFTQNVKKFNYFRIILKRWLFYGF